MEYVLGLVAISSIVGMCSFISYGDAEDRYLKMAASLLIVYSMVLPVVTLVRDAFQYDFYVDLPDSVADSINDTQLSDDAEAAFCEGIKKYICADFSLSSDEVSVKAFGFDVINMRAEKIKVILRGRAVLADNRAIAEEIVASGLGECEVELSVK